MGIVGISMDDADDALAMVELTGHLFPVLSDPSHVAIDAYGVYDLLGDGVATPSTFIIDSDRSIMWFYVGKDIADRPSASHLLDVLDMLYSLGISA